MHRKPVIFFDGFCNLCSGSAQFVIRNDRKRIFRLLPLQGREAKYILETVRRDDNFPDSIVLLQEGKVYTKSAAALRIAMRLRFPWPLFAVFFIIPPFLRDFIYDWIARNRKRWFGSRNSCYIPHED